MTHSSLNNALRYAMRKSTELRETYTVRRHADRRQGWQSLRGVPVERTADDWLVVRTRVYPRTPT